ncbi:MAG: hypothetical protein PHQ74_10680 [Crocinitomicaceae bacterium]|nr:hypothetical protein [Crocinitomicaceae bacterium]
MRFRATYYPLEYIENKLNVLFPNLETVIAISKNEQKLSVSIDKTPLPLKETDSMTVQKWRNRPGTYSWMCPQDFPWSDLQIQSNKQLELADENRNRMLLLYFISPVDQMKDLLAICFPQNTKFFGLQKELQDFTTDEKMIVGEMLHQLLSSEYYQTIQETENLKLLQRFQEKKIQKSVLNSNEHYEQFFQATCQRAMRKLEAENNVHLELDTESFGFLAQHSRSEKDILQAISKAMELAMLIQPTGNRFLLEMLHFESVIDVSNPISDSQNKDQKVIDLLNRYEEAAFLAQKSGFIVNGKNVARFMSPEISPPAITDALKKNKAKIEKMMPMFPNEWQLIRKSLKPLREIEEFPTQRMVV